MGNFDDFDLNFTYDKDTNTKPNGVTGKVCETITYSIEVCGEISELIDCLSKKIDCSGGEWSKCNACGSSAINVARC